MARAIEARDQRVADRDVGLDSRGHHVSEEAKGRHHVTVFAQTVDDGAVTDRIGLDAPASLHLPEEPDRGPCVPGLAKPVNHGAERDLVAREPVAKDVAEELLRGGRRALGAQAVEERAQRARAGPDAILEEEAQ